MCMPLGRKDGKSKVWGGASESHKLFITWAATLLEAGAFGPSCHPHGTIFTLYLSHRLYPSDLEGPCGQSGPQEELPGATQRL